jgi:hypothetical protein
MVGPIRAFHISKPSAAFPSGLTNSSSCVSAAERPNSVPGKPVNQDAEHADAVRSGPLGIGLRPG